MSDDQETMGRICSSALWQRCLYPHQAVASIPQDAPEVADAGPGYGKGEEVMMVESRGTIGKARQGPVMPRFGSPIPMCWYCGSGTWNGNLVTQPDGTLLHEGCQRPAERDYPGRVIYDGEQADAKVRWQDQRGWDHDGETFWAQMFSIENREECIDGQA